MAIPTPAVAKKTNLSGQAWWTANQAKATYSNSTSIDELEASFQLNIKAFKKALDDAGANIVLSTTRRSENRAYILH